MTKMRSQHQFSQVPRADIPRSSFNLSHGLKTTFDVDGLVPILVQDVIPGDTWNVQCNFFMRLSTPVHPILDNMYAETFFFFVPYRTIWQNHEKFHGAQDDPGDSIDFAIPLLADATAVVVGSILDYMGVPLGLIPDSRAVSAMPHRAYIKIWNEWFRDENLQDSKILFIGNGPDAIGPADGVDLLPRGKRFDYFTSCLPSPQKGTAVSLPLGTTAPIFTDALNNETLGVRSLQTDTLNRTLEVLAAPGDLTLDTATLADGGFFADLTGATAASINDIRLAFQTQRLLEQDARAGTRYVEALKAHWGVTSPDHRLQRTEFLGGGSSPVNITPVAQTSAQPTPVAEDQLGQLGGFGTVSGKHSFSKSFVEHGVIIGLMNVRGDITYSQGLDRMWSKDLRFDFFYPVLAGIGEQSVLNMEIWQDNSANDVLVFGYQGRYDEYRFINSRLTALMRVDAPSSLSTWHLSEDFATLPALGATFIEANTSAPLDRAIGVATEPHFIADIFFKIKAARPLPTYGVPGNIDRF